MKPIPSCFLLVVVLATRLLAQTEFTTTASGLQYAITRHGSGPQPSPGQVVIAHYTGTLDDGTVFDSSRARNQPFAFTLGQKQVIRGWDEGFTFLRVGDHATLLIPAELAYGDKARGKIPANSRLRFEVEFVDLKDKSLADLLREAADAGGAGAVRSRYDQAKAEGGELYVSEPQLNGLGYRYLKRNKLSEGLEILRLTADLFPDSGYAHDGLAEAYQKNQQFELAIAHYEKAVALSSDNDNAKRALVRLRYEAKPDPYLWLEDVAGEKALAWVKEQNAVTQRELEASADFKSLQAKLLAILESNERIPEVSKHGDFYYNFWRDAKNGRGVWRRTTLEEYRKPQPAWETVLDLDVVARAENENWVWKGSNWLQPTYDRCLLSLSRGGGDAVVVREFDITSKAFVEGGFVIAESKSRVSWKDRDTLYVGTDFGPGTLTDSGYPRISKEWARGTPLSQAKIVREGEKTDMGVSTSVSIEPGFRREIVSRQITFYSSERFMKDGDMLTKIEIPADSALGTWREFLLVTLRSDWNVGARTYPSGALIVIPWTTFLEGGRVFEILYTPGARKSLAGYSTLRHHIVINELENVRNQLYVATPSGENTWQRARLDTPSFGAVSIEGIDDESDDYWLTVADFLTPTSLYRGTVGMTDRERLKALPAFFNGEGVAISQHEATSKDDVRVPYFQVGPKNLKADGSNPTLLYGYGGFRISQTPGYSGGRGVAWLEKGGVFILANIRGGGEFGPEWHKAALKENRQKAYDDFIAIAEDLIARKITSPKHLGIQGGSNGGLLVGVMVTERPDLFGAVVCQVPLLDMRRFNQLLAGASWMGEYGNPDVPAEWDYIRQYSPYQNVSADMRYPRTLFTTSTRDDRVHPGHARKMMARMMEQKHDVLYYENIEGGHGGAANQKQSAYMTALAYTFLWNELAGKGARSANSNAAP